MKDLFLMFKTILQYSLIAIALIAFAAPTSKSSELTEEAKLLRLINTLKLHKPISNKDKKAIVKALLTVTKHNSACKVSWITLLGVALQESSLDKNAQSKTKDYGIMQINSHTISRLKLNKKRLLKDVAYSFYAGCYVLTKNKEKYSKTRPYWVGIYNSGVMFNNPKVLAHAKSYDNKIKRHVRLIKLQAARLYALDN